jgi:hypothetical protein
MKRQEIFAPSVCLALGSLVVVLASPVSADFMTIRAVEPADRPPLSVLQGTTKSIVCTVCANYPGASSMRRISVRLFSFLNRLFSSGTTFAG